MAKADVRDVKRPPGRPRYPRLSAQSAGDAGQHSGGERAVPGVVSFADYAKRRKEAGR